MTANHPVSKNGNGHIKAPLLVADDAAFGYPRDFLDNQFVYLVISPRARGLSVGVNCNPVMKCNFNCLYCEVDRTLPPRSAQLDTDRMARELNDTLALAFNHQLRQWPRYASLPDQLLEVQHVALSGDGEPTLSGNFVEVMQAVTHVRAAGGFPFFKIVLITNATELAASEVQRGLKHLTRADEVWAKLDAGTQEYFNKVNGAVASIETITDNILMLGRQRPIVIQSLFPAINGEETPDLEIEMYARRLKRLKEGGANITLVQIYSATRPMARVGCSHLPLRSLSRIARTVREVAGLRAEVF
jgi:wyosine [tRNA(Phe)-imidazoG37] synthetase (radical SAM superfamily)